MDDQRKTYLRALRQTEDWRQLLEECVPIVRTQMKLYRVNPEQNAAWENEALLDVCECRIRQWDPEVAQIDTFLSPYLRGWFLNKKKSEGRYRKRFQGAEPVGNWSADPSAVIADRTTDEVSLSERGIYNANQEAFEYERPRNRTYRAPTKRRVLRAVPVARSGARTGSKPEMSRATLLNQSTKSRGVAPGPNSPIDYIEQSARRWVHCHDWSGEPLLRDWDAQDRRAAVAKSAIVRKVFESFAITWQQQRKGRPGSSELLNVYELHAIEKLSVAEVARRLNLSHEQSRNRVEVVDTIQDQVVHHFKRLDAHHKTDVLEKLTAILLQSGDVPPEWQQQLLAPGAPAN